MHFVNISSRLTREKNYIQRTLCQSFFIWAQRTNNVKLHICWAHRANNESLTHVQAATPNKVVKGAGRKMLWWTQGCPTHNNCRVTFLSSHHFPAVLLSCLVLAYGIAVPCYCSSQKIIIAIEKLFCFGFLGSRRTGRKNWIFLCENILK